jgi:hypothetical protein
MALEAKTRLLLLERRMDPEILVPAVAVRAGDASVEVITDSVVLLGFHVSVAGQALGRHHLRRFLGEADDGFTRPVFSGTCKINVLQAGTMAGLTTGELRALQLE